MNSLELNLKNIGLIKEATIKIDGLTVIAGENDTGKSTVGKSLFFINEYNFERLLSYFIDIFSFQPQENVEITFNERIFNLKEINLDGSKSFYITFIETPIITNLFHLFSQLDTVQNEITAKLLNSNIDKIENSIIHLMKKYRFNIPFTLQDLYKKLHLGLNEKSSLDQDEFLNNLKNIIDGEFIYVPFKELIFKRGNQEFDVNSVATGIKNFGILQLLIKNNYLTKDSILIVDEPEAHLHPKWQLEYAKFIVELVKNGVKVLITSHSPYMVEALELYSKQENINTHFYLANKVNEASIIENVSHNLERIYKKLAEPFSLLEELDDAE